MKKILIFGCSFSVGSYEIMSDGKEHLGKNSKCWYHFVDYFKDKDVTVIACPAQGYWGYYQIILHLLEESKLILYDEIWIQETWEPRPTINNYNVISRLFFSQIDHIKLSIVHDQPDFSKNVKNFIFNYSENILNLNGTIEKYKPYSLWNKFFIEMGNSCAYKINKLCKEENIKGYVWSMMDPIMNCGVSDSSTSEFTRLPLTYVYLKLKEAEKNKNFLAKPTGHQTEEGNKYIGELINKACIDLKI